MKNRWLLSTLVIAFGAHAGAAIDAQQPMRAPSPNVAEASLETLVAIPSQWRAASRFGYGPVVGVAGPIDRLEGKTWALNELALAADAALQPPRIPEAFSGFQAPIPELFAQEKSSRQMRNQDRETLTRQASAAQGSAMSIAMAPTSSQLQKAAPLFSQEIATRAANWRLWTCSQPEQEPPLLARMTEFWFNHLNVFVGKGADRPFVGNYVVNAIRPHALGRFEDLLLASARHPAMLHYLDQVRSRAEGSPAPQGAKTPSGLNENYARELLELHTMGVGSGYTQHDVRELARILTGWTVDPSSESGFRFVAPWHDTGDKVLLGQRFVNNGEQEGIDALRMLARQPATAHRISLRLAQWFVADNPPQQLVQRLAQRYLQTQGDIRAVMQTLIESPETWDPGNQLFKTPMDYACSVLTAIGPKASEPYLQQAQRFLRDAGQPLHGWPTPDGYNTSASTWLSPEALTRRSDFAIAVGRAMPQASAFARWLPPDIWARIAQEPPAQQVGLALASPTFMRK